MDVFVVELSGRTLALDPADVGGPVVLGPVTEAPGLPPQVCGAMAHQGRVVAVVDLRILIEGGREDRRDPPRAGEPGVLVEAREQEAVLRVDAVRGVRAAVETEQGWAPEAAPVGSVPVRHALLVDGRPAVLVDTGALLETLALEARRRSALLELALDA